MSEWKKVRLGDCCEITSSKRIFYSDYVESGVPFYRSKEIIESFEGVRNFSETLYITEERYNEIKNRFGVPSEGDLLLTSVGTIGVPYLVKQDDRFYFKDGNLTWFRSFEKTLDSKFLFYWLQTNQGKGELDAHTIGSSQKALTIRGLKEVSVLLPDIKQQRRTISILSDYDSAIDNARRQIVLLEEAAMRLYREWFVINADPKWEKKRIVDVCSRIGAGGTPNRRQEKYWLNGTIDWIKTKELQDCWLFDSEEKITSAGLDESSAKIYPANTVVMAIYASPTLGRLGILDKPMCCNQAALCLVADESQVSWEWLYCQLFELRDEFNRIARGAGQQNISGEVVKETVVRIPDIHAMSEFTNAARPLFSQCRSLGRQIRSLTEARDRLLPKLMSGEIEV